MRFAVAGLSHETNTFAHGLTTLDDFVGSSRYPGLIRGEEVITAMRGTSGCTDGFIAAAEAAGDAELVPLLWTFPQPSGLVEQTAFEMLAGMLLVRLAEALPVDGVLLELHGAMVTERCPDAEGELLRRVRQVVGPDLPVVATLDLHANISPEMVEHATALVGYDTYPHVDNFARGQEAFGIIADAVRGRTRPVAALAQVPMLIGPPRQCTLTPPMQDMLALVHEREQQPGIISITLAGGFPFADTPCTGAAVVAIADGDKALARSTAQGVADEMWARREDFRLRLTPLQEAIGWALEHGGPVILADGSDNPGGGAPCDGTVMLQALIEAQAPNSTVAIIVDPESVAAAWDAGEGREITLNVGGKTDDRHGQPLTLTGTVRLLSEGNYVNEGPMTRGLPVAMGRTAVFVVGGVEIVLTERRIQPYDTQALRCLGIEPAERLLIGLKSAVHFRAAFGPLARRILEVDTPGVHNPDVTQYTFSKLGRPMWPLDLE
ncbi:M81 family metallopeptidase [bacterium]|nr:M81 family metallopeptidase [bacterium]